MKIILLYIFILFLLFQIFIIHKQIFFHIVSQLYFKIIFTLHIQNKNSRANIMTFI